MGKRKNIYFKDDDIILKLEQESNAAELISGLLKDHYNQSLEFLERKKNDLITETKLIELKIQNILKIQNSNRILTKEMELEGNQIKHKKSITDKIKSLLHKNKILEKDYFNLFDDGKLNIIKAEELLNEKMSFL